MSNQGTIEQISESFHEAYDRSNDPNYIELQEYEKTRKEKEENIPLQYGL